MRPVNPVVRATRGTAGVAFAATFVLTGSTGALADGTTQADAAAESANIIAPVTAPAVTIPAAQKHDGAAFGVFAAETATLKPEAPAVEVEETETRADRDEDANEDTREENSRDREDRDDNERTDRDDERSDRENRRSNRDNGERSNRDDENDEENSRSSENGDEDSDEASSPSVAGSSIFATAKKGIGVRYVFGGSSRSGWDCSGFTSWVYRQHGINLPHSARAQVNMGKRISKSEARPGDLVYHPGHVGIYAGNGMILDAGNKAKGTSIRKLWSANWSYYRIVD